MRAMNWTSLIADLRGAGLTRADIATQTGSGTSTIADLEMIDGREPRYALGQRLIELHTKVCILRQSSQGKAA